MNITHNLNLNFIAMWFTSCLPGFYNVVIVSKTKILKLNQILLNYLEKRNSFGNANKYNFSFEIFPIIALIFTKIRC